MPKLKNPGNKILFIPFLVFVMLFIQKSGFSQISRSAFFLDELPSANVINPAFHPNYKAYINLPLISTLYMGFESPFSFNDLTGEWEGGDSLYIDRESVLNNLKDQNYFSFELYNELGRVGVNFGKHYLHASIAKIFSTKFSFDSDFAELIFYGNASPKFFGNRVEINGTGLNSTSYHEFALGYSFTINKILTIGTRLKYLNGAFNIWSERASFQLYTDSEPNYATTASLDILLHSSSTISSFDNMVDQVINYKWFDLSDNHGVGIDLGLQFHPNEKLNISASVTDIGRIYWQENVRNFESENPGVDFTFNGFDIKELINGGSVTDSINVLDTIVDHFQLVENDDPYISHLNPKIYLGSTWSFNKNNDLGILVRMDLAENKVQPSLTLNYLHRFGKVLSVYGNYSFLANSYNNLGFGFVAKVGPVQLYLLNDIAYSLAQPGDAKNYNFHFGINFLFGDLEKRANIDPELIEKE